MRCLLLLVLCALASGCLDDASTGSSDPQNDDPPAANTRTETVRIPLVQAAAVDGAATPLQGTERFRVGPGTVSLDAAADWSCVTNCPLVVRLVAPDGTVQAEDSGWGVDMVVAAPAPGEWQVLWSSRDGATVGVMGEMVLTFTITP